MKRFISAILTVLMLVSISTAEAFANGEELAAAELAEEEGEAPKTSAEPLALTCTKTEGCTLAQGHEGDCVIPQSTVLPAEQPPSAPIESPAASAEISAESTEAPAEESAAPVETLPSLAFIGCETVDEDGAGHYVVDAIIGETAALSVNAESGGELSYIWQKYDSEAEDYSDLDIELYPDANTASVNITVTEDMLGCKDLFICLVTAALDGNTLTLPAMFTIIIAQSLEEAEDSIPLRAAGSNNTDDWRYWGAIDKRWKDEKMGSPNGGEAATVGTVGCVVLALTKLILQSGLRASDTFDPGTLAKDLNSIGGFNPGVYLSNWGKPSEVVPGFIYSSGFNDPDIPNPILSGNSTACSDTIMKFASKGYYTVLKVKK